MKRLDQSQKQGWILQEFIGYMAREFDPRVTVVNFGKTIP